MRSTLGPDFGFFPNKKKWWIIAKPDKTESVKEVFKEKDVKITQRGTAIGSREYQEEFVSKKVPDWVSEIY